MPEDSNLEIKFGRGRDETEFRIILATQSNHVYYISFDKYYLRKNETIYVEKSDDDFLQHLQRKTVKAFEKVWDLEKKEELFVFGAAANV